MKKLSASTRRLATIGIAAAVAIALNPGLVDAAADYPAVTYQRLTDAQRDPGWLTYYRTYNGQSHSPLKQIDPSNVKQ
ncbi:PQQ-dependent dehydrogenase, methanol/ethanol family, partial [Cupriavidus sp. SIMBA_020]